MFMTDATRRYHERAARDTQDRIDGQDPVKMLASLKLQGAKVTKIQMRTLCWDDREQLAGHLRVNPLLGQVFINLVREDLEKRTP